MVQHSLGSGKNGCTDLPCEEKMSQPEVGKEWALHHEQLWSRGCLGAPAGDVDGSWEGRASRMASPDQL